MFFLRLSLFLYGTWETRSAPKVIPTVTSQTIEGGGGGKTKAKSFFEEGNLLRPKQACFRDFTVKVITESFKDKISKSKERKKNHKLALLQTRIRNRRK